MRREAWIGLAASLVLHGVLAALLLLSIDAGPVGMEGEGTVGSRTRVRLVERAGAEGGGEAAAPAEESLPPGGRTAKTAPAPAPPPSPRSERTVASEAPAEGGRADAPAIDTATSPASEPGVAGGTDTGAEAGAGEGPGTGDGAGAGSGAGTGAGTSGAGGSPASEDLHARAIATLSSRLSSAARTCYPPAAKRMRLRGEVTLRFCLDGGGRAVSLEVEHGSGSPLLDRAALECVVPRALPVRDAGGCFSLPVRFGE